MRWTRISSVIALGVALGAATAISPAHVYAAPAGSAAQPAKPKIATIPAGGPIPGAIKVDGVTPVKVRGIQPTAQPVGSFVVMNQWWGSGCMGDGYYSPGYQAVTTVCNFSNPNGSGQLWDIYPIGAEGNGGTWYEVVNHLTGLCLDADANHLRSNGDHVQTWYCNNESQQRWGFTMTTNYTQRWVNMAAYEIWLNDTFLMDSDISNPYASYQHIQLWQSVGGTNQYWRIP